MNKNLKGYRAEKRCFDELENYPYRWKTIRHRFLKIDLFGEFDVVAGNEKELNLYQVKSVKNGYVPNKVRHDIADIKLLSEVYCPKCNEHISICKKHLWILVNREGWKKEVIE